MTSGEYLEQEARCRRLAAQAMDDDLRTRLLRLADEYGEAARHSAGAKPRPPLSES